MSKISKARQLAEVVLPFTPAAPVGTALGKLEKLTASSKDLDAFVRHAEAFLEKEHPGTHKETLARRGRVLEAARRCAQRIGDDRFRALAATSREGLTTALAEQIPHAVHALRIQDDFTEELLGKTLGMVGDYAAAWTRSHLDDAATGRALDVETNTQVHQGLEVVRATQKQVGRVDENVIELHAALAHTGPVPVGGWAAAAATATAEADPAQWEGPRVLQEWDPHALWPATVISDSGPLKVGVLLEVRSRT